MRHIPENYKETLAHFDEREAEIARLLPRLKLQLSAREYARIEAQYARELRQMSARRKILQAVEHEMLVRELREAFKACGRLIEH